MKVTVIGCGEAFDENYPNTSVLVEGPLTILLDCGYSVPPAVWRAGFAANDIDLVYISHAHADHYFGLPALLGRMWEDGRRRPLTILSQPAVLDQVRDILEYGYRTLTRRFLYPIEFLAAEADRIGDVRFSFAPSMHSVPNLMVRIEAGGKAVCYSGDGMFTGGGGELAAGADLLIHEAYSMAESPVHTGIPGLIAMAAAGGVKRLAMVHVQRGLRAAPSPVENAIRDAALPVELPAPGSVFVL
jgi:ribonuclease BN (tRNA processing enzyme)